MDPIESVDYNGFETSECNSHVDHGWKKVVFGKRNRKQKPADQSASDGVSGKIIPNGRQILEEKMVASYVEDEARSKRRSGDKGYDFDDSDDERATRDENLKAEETKKPKVSLAEAAAKKPEVSLAEAGAKIDPSDLAEKKPEVSLAEAAAKIDPSDLAAYLVKISKSYFYEPEVQLLRFVDYLGRTLSTVQFPWPKMFKESPWPKLIDVIDFPLSHIPEPVYKTSVDWINKIRIGTLSAFVLWALNNTLTYLAPAQQGGPGGWEQGRCSKSQVAIFVALAMILRKRPNALTIVLWTLRESHEYQGHDKLPITVWMMAQASEGDLSVGLYSWACNLLPVVGSNPQSRDLILQLVEKILSNPNARTILVNGAVLKEHRLIPPPSFEILLRLTFPASSARVKATERFEAIYPLLKEVALSVAPGSKLMKQVTQQIFNFSLKLAGEGNPVLAKEATSIAIWSMTKTVDCCKHLESLCKEDQEASVPILEKLVDEWKDHSLNLSSSPSDSLTLKQTKKSIRLKNKKAITEGEASVAVLKKLVDEWKDHSLKLSSSPGDTLTLKQTKKSVRLKNENAITEGGASGSVNKEADKSCRVILGRRSLGSGCLKVTAITAVVLGAVVVLSSNLGATSVIKKLVDSLDLHLYFNAITRALRK